MNRERATGGRGRAKIREVRLRRTCITGDDGHTVSPDVDLRSVWQQFNADCIGQHVSICVVAELDDQSVSGDRKDAQVFPVRSGVVAVIGRELLIHINCR